MTTITLPRAVAEQALEALTVAWQQNPRWQITESMHALRAALAQQAEPLTIERLRDALVASRIIQPSAVEDPEEYDDGVTLFRIEALHRRIT
jgi:hypothetical protein